MIEITVALRSDYSITIARRVFQFPAIQDIHRAPAVLDQAC
ncbi:MAG: hypothetical protein QOK48_1677, partial [Blastocatellia bacterium]|nr:hypothetical protein [Blastocatellia bacterium]